MSSKHASADCVISACVCHSRTSIQRASAAVDTSAQVENAWHAVPADAVSMQDAATAAGKQRATNKLLRDHRLGRCSPVTSFSKQCSACGNHFWYDCQTCNVLAVITLRACQQMWPVA